MMNRMSLLAAPIMLAAMCGGASAQSPAAAPMLVGTFEDWLMFSYTGSLKAAKAAEGQATAPGKICYIYTELSDEEEAPKKAPKGAMLPPSVKHGRVTFSITSSPTEGIPQQASFTAGYTLKEKAPVTVDVDGRKFTMFTEGDSAWMINTAEEPQLLEAMKSGSNMTITAQSRRGNKTTYKYSLDGVTAAADKMTDECK